MDQDALYALYTQEYSRKSLDSRIVPGMAWAGARGRVHDAQSHPSHASVTCCAQYAQACSSLRKDKTPSQYHRGC